MRSLRLLCSPVAALSAFAFHSACGGTSTSALYDRIEVEAPAATASSASPPEEGARDGLARPRSAAESLVAPSFERGRTLPAVPVADRATSGGGAAGASSGAAESGGSGAAAAGSSSQTEGSAVEGSTEEGAEAEGAGLPDPALPDPALPTDGTVSVREACEFVPCGGGALEGSEFEYVGACVQRGALLRRLGGICDNLEIVGASGLIGGDIRFEDGEAERHVTLSFVLSFLLPQECTVLTCAATAARLLVGGALGAACQSAGGGACQCSMPLTLDVDETVGFETSGDELRLGDATVSYCAQGGNLRYTGGLDPIDFVLSAVER